MSFLKKMITGFLFGNVVMVAFAERAPRDFCDVPLDQVRNCIIKEAIYYKVKTDDNFAIPGIYGTYSAKFGDVETTAELINLLRNDLPNADVKDGFKFFHYFAQMQKEPNYEMAQKMLSLKLYYANRAFSENIPLYIYEIFLDYDAEIAEKFFNEYVWPLLLREKVIAYVKINPFVYVRFLQEKGLVEKLEEFKPYMPADTLGTYLSYCDASQAFALWKTLSARDKGEMIDFRFQIGRALLQKKEYKSAFRIIKGSDYYKYLKKQKGESKERFMSVFSPIIDELSYHPDIFEEAVRFIKPIGFTESYAKALYRQGYKKEANLLSFAHKEDILKVEEIKELIKKGEYEKADEKLEASLVDGKLSAEIPFIYFDPIVYISLADNEIGEKYRKAIYNSPISSFSLDVFAKYGAHDFAATAFDNIINQFKDSPEKTYKARGDQYEFLIKGKEVISSNFYQYISKLGRHNPFVSWDFIESSFQYNADYCRDRVK